MYYEQRRLPVDFEQQQHANILELTNDRDHFEKFKAAPFTTFGESGYRSPVKMKSLKIKNKQFDLQKLSFLFSTAIAHCFLYFATSSMSLSGTFP